MFLSSRPPTLGLPPQFCAVMIQTLSVILLTSRELRTLRDRLRRLRHNASSDPALVAFFCVIYEAFAHNAVATVSLCLLCELYEHAAELLTIVAGYEMTVDFLCELDKLVQLVESPVFASLRLQLLDPKEHPHLFRAIYALLMILPQSAAFLTLQRRLACVSTLNVVDPPSSSGETVTGVHFARLKNAFVLVQERQLAYREEQRGAKYREMLSENARVGRKLMEAIAKRAAMPQRPATEQRSTLLE